MRRLSCLKGILVFGYSAILVNASAKEDGNASSINQTESVQKLDLENNEMLSNLRHTEIWSQLMSYQSIFDACYDLNIEKLTNAMEIKNFPFEEAIQLTMEAGDDVLADSVEEQRWKLLDAIVQHARNKGQDLKYISISTSASKNLELQMRIKTLTNDENLSSSRSSTTNESLESLAGQYEGIWQKVPPELLKEAL